MVLLTVCNFTVVYQETGNRFTLVAPALQSQKVCYEKKNMVFVFLVSSQVTSYSYPTNYV